MLFLPLLSDFLLLNHDSVGALFVALVALLRLQELIFEVSDLDVTLIVELVHSAMENNLQTVQLGDGAFLFITELVNQLSKAVVVIEVSLVVTHVRVKLDLLLVLEYSSLLALVLYCLKLFLQLLVLALRTSDFLLTHCLLLVNCLIVALVLDGSVLFECPPLVLQFSNFLS